MSFLKIKDPAKRDETLKEYLKTRKNIRDRQLAEKTGEIEFQSDLSKFFKPITDVQKATSEKITEELKPIKGVKEGINKLPNYPSIQLFTSKDGEVSIDEDGETIIGPMAFKHLMKYAGKKDLVDKTYGLYSKDGKFYIGDKEVTINGNDITLDNEVYEGTPGLWELITSRQPDQNIFNEEDYERYSKIVVKCNTLFHGNNPHQNYPKSSRGKKWTLLKDIWANIRPGKEGSGVIIPSDTKALKKRLKILLASKQAGNTGLRNEIVSICDELKRQGQLDKTSYKKLMTIL